MGMSKERYATLTTGVPYKPGRTPSKQQARWLTHLPNVRELRSMNGNHARTVTSLIEAGWAEWHGAGDWADLVITEAGRQAVERYKLKKKPTRRF
jgi:hypothetical protein